MTPTRKKKLRKYYELLRERIFREQVTKDRIRPDRRAFDEIRAITIEVGVLPRTHGSALFTRGETQALVTATLGTTDDAQRLETYEGEKKKRFMLHYNFPPFSRWRNRPHDRNRPSRDRPRSTGRACDLPPFCPARKSRHTRSASSPTFWSRTVLRRWRRSAAQALR